MIEQFFIGMLFGFVLVGIVALFIWNETLYNENDQKRKR